MSTQPPNTELLWRQYSQNVELFKFYMDLVVKLNVFYYAVTGAIASFYFTHTDVQSAKYGLLLPLIMSLALALFFVYGIVLNNVVRNDIFEIRDALGLRVAPDVGVLSVFLAIFALVFVLVAFGCTYILLTQ